ncbi:MAG: hypothetical protein C4532_18815 [Candidatus Abyssobacteria bacterium SURF_17]|uniref:Phosphoenolpyruvate synthase n=1 Tax=Candidatus Abyssobacteria bacterium SURF_17 TaxID=2093361 RepID=A0A419EPD8_9BACT|nr:MAG: hypothetical protein C4532_18815 [Candidatus Abyssubacteria bacterium SURF_17]
MTDKRTVLNLDAIRDTDEAAVGAKATCLVRMKWIGLQVPAGFCIPAPAYQEHVSSNDLAPLIASALEQLRRASHSEKRDILARVRREIIRKPLSESLRRDIENCFRQLAADRVAVRSSATAEDLPGHSFAGQYDTYLNLAGIHDCLESIKKCWASLWNDRAYDYREQNSFDHRSAAMAVIVQELVPAEAAGVVFTVDPVSGKSDRLVIEACRGLGEMLVSGRVNPDRFILSDSDLHIQAETEETVRSESPPFSCISEATAKRIGKLAKNAESAFGCPQDMEWALKDGEIFFLQSRPIGALPGADSYEDRQIWTNLNAGEVLPDVATPMTWSIVTRMVPDIFNSILNGMGLDIGDNPLIRQFAGRAYFNLHTVTAIMRYFPGLSKKDITQVFGGEQERLAELGHIHFADEDIAKLNFSLPRALIGMPGFIFRVLLFPYKRAGKLLAEVRRRADKLARLDTSSISEDSLLQNLRTAMNDIGYVALAVPFAGIGILFLTLLDKVCRRWLDDHNGTIGNRLLVGVGGLQSAESGLELWSLAARVHEHQEVATAILSGDDWLTTRMRLEKTSEGAAFLSRWDEFMEEHGHHARGELELANARWWESPDYILAAVRGYLQGFGGAAPVENHRNRAAERQQLERECRSRLRNPIKRFAFNFFLRQAQQGVLIRENLKNVAVRYLAAVRLVLLALGDRLASRGILENRDDIFYLSMEEVELVALGEAQFNVREAVTVRRKEYDRNLTITPPKVIVGNRFDPRDSVHDAVDETAEYMIGVAVSAGVAVGPARVILRTDTQEQVLPGEILVAPFTDPGWTPYFVSAAGIVMDQGGILSHGSIIAREYGIPAVVNVGPATKIIKTGQTVRVDGNTGTVSILK